MGERTTATTAPYTVGTVPFRPGDELVFAKGFKEQPGDLGMPDPIKATADDTMAHAKGLVRVLDDDGNASGEWDPQLDEDSLKLGLEYMLRLRVLTTE